MTDATAGAGTTDTTRDRALGPDELQERLTALIAEAGVTGQKSLVRRILATGIGLGLDGTSRLDLKITAAAVEEMRAAFRLFAPYRDAPKATIFGSARTRTDDPLWRGAEAVARGLADRDWIVVTGAGPGIMEAAATGAGEERSLGVSIRLPFEEAPNSIAASQDRSVSMKYFFTRKLMLVKESRGFVCLPGGFGTMDELFELLTLQQTGKMIPVPIVLVDRPDGTFWAGFKQYIEQELETAGMISPNDLDRVLITTSADEAAEEITGFWRNYDSLRWFGKELVLRLRETPSDDELAELNDRFAYLIREGRIERTEARSVEIRDNDIPEAPRIVFTPQQRQIGSLHRLIRALNELESAPVAVAKPSQ